MLRAEIPLYSGLLAESAMALDILSYNAKKFFFCEQNNKKSQALLLFFFIQRPMRGEH